MAVVHCQGQDFEVAPAESLLDCLRRNHVPIVSGCKQGVCQACMLKAIQGTVSARAQEPLRDTLRVQGYFLACRCYPAADLAVELSSEPLQTRAEVVASDRLTEKFWRVRLRADSPFPYHAGQYVKLTRADALTRNVALSSVPGASMPAILTGIEILTDRWLEGETSVLVQGPFGDCFYVPEQQEGSLLLAAEGTGLGSLDAIVRDALAKGHSGPMWVFHEADGYLIRELEALAASHANLHCASLRELEDVIAVRFPNLSSWRAYLAGDPATVRPLRRILFRAGIEMKAIHCNDFT